eukprot:436707-Hanusia_phi.AAC.1
MASTCLGEGMAPVQFEEGSEERLVVAIAAAVEDQDVCNLFDVVALCCINMRSVPESTCIKSYMEQMVGTEKCTSRG